MSKLDGFLAGERTEDVALYLADDYMDEDGVIAERGEAVDDGVVLVVPGEKGRRLFSAGTGMDAMQFAKAAMDADGEIAPVLGGGECPAGADHEVQFVFAFAEEENPEVGGLYAEGDVIHAYAHCECGESYSQKWLAGER